MLTIDSNGVRIWLRAAAVELASAERLRAMWRRRKPSEDREALWDGWYYVNAEAERSVKGLVDAGGLLHFGSAAALARVNEPERRYA